ncbi:putative glucosaminidase [Pelagibacter phage Mosig EXVC030M]|nr:putative glucosaminidase [Pelagibacter phage Mosig EXVC030M]
MRLIEKIKLIASTLMVVTIVAFSFGLYHLYQDSQAQAKEQELEQIVETLETINTYTKPDFERANNQTFINSVGACVNYIYNTTTDVTPVIYEVLLAQAALESGWGNSRFALEGKNLFGIRTYDLREPHMLPSNNPKKWGVRVYMHECDSVQHYIDILNNGSAYDKYRELRDNGVEDSLKYVETLGAYASDKNYFPKVKSIIKKLRTEYDIPQLD